MLWAIILFGVVYYAVFCIHKPYLYFKSKRISAFFQRYDSPTDTTFAVPYLSLVFTGTLNTLWAWIVRGSDNVVTAKRRETHNDVVIDFIFDQLPCIGVLVILKHSLGGKFLNGLINDLIPAAKAKHFCVCVVFSEGLEGLQLDQTKTLNSAFDIINETLGARVPKYLVGASLGGLSILKFLATQTEKKIRAASVICAPIEDLDKSLISSDIAHNLILETGKIFAMKHSEELTSEMPERVNDMMQAGTLKDFLRVAIKLDPGDWSGLTDAVEKIPLLLVFGIDDPFADFKAVDLIRLIRKENVIVAACDNAGHCGFFSGLKGKRYIQNLVIDFFDGSVKPIVLYFFFDLTYRNYL